MTPLQNLFFIPPPTPPQVASLPPPVLCDRDAALTLFWCQVKTLRMV
jgi:hypothetical protein